jgi:hypothetical protein
MFTDLLLRDDAALSWHDANTSGSIPNRVLAEAGAISREVATIIGDYLFISPTLLGYTTWGTSLPADEPTVSFGYTDRFVSLWALFVDAQMNNLRVNYVMRNEDAIKEFLAVSNRRLFPALLGATARIKAFFGQDTIIELEVVEDPEANSKQLFGYIHARSLSVEQALVQLARFDDSWFLKQYEMTDGLLNFNLE